MTLTFDIEMTLTLRWPWPWTDLELGLENGLNSSKQRPIPSRVWQVLHVLDQYQAMPWHSKGEKFTTWLLLILWKWEHWIYWIQLGSKQWPWFKLTPLFTWHIICMTIVNSIPVKRVIWSTWRHFPTAFSSCWDEMRLARSRALIILSRLISILHACRFSPLVQGMRQGQIPISFLEKAIHGLMTFYTIYIIYSWDENHIRSMFRDLLSSMNPCP